MIPTATEVPAGERSSTRPAPNGVEWLDYLAMGGILRSNMPFPELPARVGPASVANWTLRVVRAAPPATDVVPLGERTLGVEQYRLGRTPSGFRLEYSHAGCFDVSADGAAIVWYPTPDASAELARSIVLGPGLAIALEAAGLLCLHGSAVTLDHHAIAFVGSKHRGKSTMAVGLTRHGARLISDDLVAVDAGPPATVRPGIPSARLWADAASELRVDDLCDTVVAGVKQSISGFARQALWQGDAPLAAVYLLEPEPDDGGAACWREPRAGADAVITLAHQTKLPASLVGHRAAGAQLRAAAAVARTVPVYLLHVARNFSRLPEVAQQLRSWHSR